MMNRYMIEGLMSDAATDGDLVIFVGSGREIVSLLDSVQEMGIAREVRRVHGDEQVRFESGGRLIFARSERALRGYSADVVYVSDSKRDDQGIVESAWISVNARRGEVIIA